MEEQYPVPLLLAIEAGSSKTDVAVVDMMGRLLALTRGDGLGPNESSAFWLETLKPLIERVWHTARARQPGIDASSRFHVLTACVPHLDLPQDELDFTKLLHTLGWADNVSVHNDTFATLRSGTSIGPDGSGIAIVCGSGINCVGVGPDGQTARFLALGDISGDWGGGNDLGAAAIWSATRAEDGRGRPTILREALLQHFQASSMREIALRRRDGSIPQKDVRYCAPVLFAVADLGDAIAGEIVHQQVEEICAMAKVALVELDLLHSGTAIVLGGSVLASQSQLLVDPVRNRLAQISAASSVELVDQPPIVGATLLGLDKLNTAPSVEARLRRALRTSSGQID